MKRLIGQEAFSVQLKKERSICEMAFDFLRLRNQCNGAISMGFFLYKYGSMEGRRIWIKINWLK